MASLRRNDARATLRNITGLDGFARDRGWRIRMLFSLDCMRAGRRGQEALIPDADVIFFSKSYARSPPHEHSFLPKRSEQLPTAYSSCPEPTKVPLSSPSL